MKNCYTCAETVEIKKEGKRWVPCYPGTHHKHRCNTAKINAPRPVYFGFIKNEKQLSPIDRARRQFALNTRSMSGWTAGKKKIILKTYYTPEQIQSQEKLKRIQVGKTWKEKQIELLRMKRAIDAREQRRAERMNPQPQITQDVDEVTVGKTAA